MASGSAITVGRGYPLVLTFKEIVYGKGFLADVKIRGRALAVRESDGAWVLNGVEPGGLAEGGRSLNDAYYSFRQTLKEIIFDISYEAPNFDAFKTQVERFVGDVNRPADQEWWKCVESIRRGELEAPDPNMREENAETKAGAEVLEIDPAVKRYEPSFNELDGYASAA